jgi:hypothetical protein
MRRTARRVRASPGSPAVARRNGCAQTQALLAGPTAMRVVRRARELRGSRAGGTNVYVYMPGRWELKTTFSGPMQDHAAPAFQVP